MADNINITEGAGKAIAFDDISSVWHQRVKVCWGVDGASVDASASDPLPVTLTNLEKAEDAAHTTGDKGIMALGVVQTSLAGTSATNADYAAMSLDAVGRLKTVSEFRAADGKANFRGIGPTATAATPLTAAATLFEINLENGDAGTNCVKLYDKATAATDSDTPIRVVVLLAGTGRQLVFPQGLKLTNGLSIRAVTEKLDNGTTGAAANTVLYSGSYI